MKFENAVILYNLLYLVALKLTITSIKKLCSSHNTQALYFPCLLIDTNKVLDSEENPDSFLSKLL